MKKLITYSFVLLLLCFLIYYLFTFLFPKKPTIQLNELQSLGFKNLDELNLKKEKTHFSENQFKQRKSFHTFQYRNRFIIQSDFPADVLTLNSNPSENWNLYYTLFAIERIILEYPHLYNLLVETFFESDFSENYNAEYRPWVNQYEKIIISFNDNMDSISSMMTELDENPVTIELNSKKVNVYRNFLIIYFNQKAIHTKHETIGSYPYYGLATDEENYHAYMNDGIVITILHELLHGLIRQFNFKKNTIYHAFSENDTFFYDNKRYDVSFFEYEEILVIRTLNKYFKKNNSGSKIIIKSSEETEAKIKFDIGEENLRKYRQQFQNTENFLSDDSLDILER